MVYCKILKLSISVGITALELEPGRSWTLSTEKPGQRPPNPTPKDSSQHPPSAPPLTHPDDGKQQKAPREENLTTAIRKAQSTTPSRSEIPFIPVLWHTRGSHKLKCSCNA